MAAKKPNSSRAFRLACWIGTGTVIILCIAAYRITSSWPNAGASVLIKPSDLFYKAAATSPGSPIGVGFALVGEPASKGMGIEPPNIREVFSVRCDR